MPYNTQYSLTLHGADEVQQERVFDMLMESGVLHYALQRDSKSEYITCEPCNWWNHDEDMLEISSKVPGVRFTLHGSGDNNGDIWESHYYNGKSYTQHAIITIPPFDPVFLREP